MSTLNRRSFLDRSTNAGLGWVAGTTILANAQSVWATPGQQQGHVGIYWRGRARWLLVRQLCGSPRLPNRMGGRRGYPPRRAAAAAAAKRQQGQDAQGRAGFPQGAGRQIGRRRRDRHARPLARPGHDLGLPGGQGRVRGEAAHAQLLGRPQDGRGRPQVQADRAGRHAEPQRTYNMAAKKYIAGRQTRQDPLLPRLRPEGVAQLSRRARQRSAAGLRLGPVERPGPRGQVSMPTIRSQWHHFWRYSGGDIANDAIHQIDLARWLLGVDYPKSVYSHRRAV